MTSAYNQGRIPEVEMRHRLRIAREFAGYEREELARLMEVSRNTVGNAEAGRTVPRKIMLNAWALACGVPVDWIITGQPPQPPDGPDNGTLDYKDEPPPIFRQRSVRSADHGIARQSKKPAA